MVVGMDSADPRQDALTWFKETSDQKVNVTRIGAALGVSRNTARSRLDEGLTAGDIITIARAFGVNPVRALQELGLVTIDEVFDYLDADGTLLSTATQEQLIRQLAEDSLPLSDRIEMGATAKALADQRDELAARRAKKSHDRGHPRPDDKDNDMPLDSVAYSGEDEDAKRDKEDRDLD